MVVIAGVDEAGRGCVIGPLVICAFAAKEGLQGELKRLGVKDSKMLSDATRKKIGKELEKLEGIAFQIVEISAEELTDYMKRKVSLNEMEAEKAAHAIDALVKKVGVETAFVDSPDPQPAKFGERIRKYLKRKEVKIVSENHADANHIVVGAASIFAKNRREERVAEVKEKLGFDFGSGYSSDEKTMAFLRKHYKDANLQKHLRHKWGTMETLRNSEVRLSDFT